MTALRALRPAFLVSALIVAAPSLSAQNLIANGDFDTDLSGWTITGDVGAASYNQEDALGWSNSGSVRIADVDSATLIFQCIPVPPTNIAHVGAAFKGSDNGLFFRTYFFGRACTGTNGPGSGVLIVGEQADFRFSYFSDRIPSGIQSVRIGYQRSQNAPMQANSFDKVFFRVGPAEPLTARAEIVSVNGDTVAFSAFSSGGFSPFGSPSYLWDFGDGETSTEQSPVHTFANDINLSILLRASTGFETAYSVLNIIFFDGFESGDTSAWSTAVLE